MSEHRADLFYKKVDFAGAKRLLDAAPRAVLMDVREETEYFAGHAAGAVLLPLDEIDERSAAALIPAKDTPVILYCRTGKRSAQAAEKLLRLGYRAVYDAGGLTGWPYGIE